MDCLVLLALEQIPCVLFLEDSDCPVDGKGRFLSPGSDFAASLSMAFLFLPYSFLCLL